MFSKAPIRTRLTSFAQGIIAWPVAKLLEVRRLLESTTIILIDFIHN